MQRVLFSFNCCVLLFLNKLVLGVLIPLPLPLPLPLPQTPHPPLPRSPFCQERGRECLCNDEMNNLKGHTLTEASCHFVLSSLQFIVIVC